MLAHLNISRWGSMWLIAVTIFVLCKAASWFVVRPRVSMFRRFGYWFVWPGLNADEFVHGQNITPPVPGEWLFATGKLILGLSCLWLGSLAVPYGKYLAGWLGMLGIIFSLHFGAFHLLSCLWRANGVAAQPLMNWPIAARSLSDFWGNRWNRAFRDLTHTCLFKPLSRRLKPSFSLMVVFLFSGLVHELAITVPAGGGYGGPTAYFTLQGAGLLLERTSLGRRLGLRGGVPGRLYVAAVTALPVFWLFPEPFVTQIVVPFVLTITGKS